jgi:hypothetical protein
MNFRVQKLRCTALLTQYRPRVALASNAPSSRARAPGSRLNLRWNISELALPPLQEGRAPATPFPDGRMYAAYSTGDE